MLGSMAYVKAHMNELDNVAGEVVVDSGIGAFTSMATGGRKDVDATLTTLLAPFPEVKVSHEAELGTDNYDFMVQGVPTFVPNQLEANYLKNYHATSDTFDKVDFEQLKKNEAVMAELAAFIPALELDIRVFSQVHCGFMSPSEAVSQSLCRATTPEAADLADTLFPAGEPFLAELDRF